MKDTEKRLIELRRDFHKHAESMWKEYRTASIVARHLMTLGIPVVMGDDLSVKGMQFQYPSEEKIAEEKRRAISQGAEPELVEKMCGLPGVMGIIDTGREGPVTAFRFDIDALPFSETDAPEHRPVKENYVSVNGGSCHACGHDGHTAIGMIVAEELMKRKESLRGRIKLIFQPAEEGGGGARGIVERGCLDDVDYFFAGHIGLTRLDGKPLPSHGIIGGTKDFLDSRRYNIIYKGKAAHPCGNPNDGKNALLASCVAALGIHTIPPHCQGEFHQNVGVMHAGSSRNTIAADSYMEVEVRGENDIVAEYGEKKMLSVVKGAAEAYEVECNVVLIGKSSSGASDDRAIEIVMRCARTIPWFTEFHDVGSVGGSDDASEMLRRVQKNGGVGSYIDLGADFTASFHDKAFDFDKGVLAPSVELFVKMVEDIHS